MDNQLLKLLENSGFTEKEAQVYLALLELGQGDVTDISKISGLKRSIIYVILEGLIKRGYVSELPDKKINTFQASDPSIILRQLQGTTKNFSEMLPIFRTLSNRGTQKPKITYHETKKGIWNMYEEMSRTKNPFFITSYASIDKFFPKAISQWVEEDIKNGLVQDGYHLMPDDEENIEIGKRFKKANQRVRVLSELKDIKMDFTLFGNKLAITSLEDNPFIVVIESEELVKSMRPIFKIAWERGKEIKDEKNEKYYV